MSIQSAKFFEEIVMYLSVLRYIFKSKSKRGLFDLNKKAEPFFREVFNIIYSLELINLNEIQNNYPAIDLGDESKKICIQITAENNSSKIKNTIKKYIENKLYEKYDRLIFFILTEKKFYTSKFNTDNKFSFDKDCDIWDLDDVLEQIEKLSIDPIEKIHSYLRKELSSIVKLFADKSSLLSQIEDIQGIKPTNLLGFLKFMGFSDEDTKIENEEIKKLNEEVLNLYNKISSLSRRSREYLYILLERAKTERIRHADIFYVLPQDIENYANLTREESRAEFQILESNNLVYYENDYPPRIEINFPMNVGVDMFVMLKDYFTNIENLKELIIDCNFSGLDA